jgi:hypothetical protein
MCQRDTIGNAQHSAQMRNHTDNVIVVGPKMETSVSAFGKTTFFTLPLRKQLSERHFSGGKNA